MNQSIDEARVLVVDNLLRDERDLSSVAREEWGVTLAAEMRRERMIAGMAIENILNNISRLVKRPDYRSRAPFRSRRSAKRFAPDAIVLSGTLRDFDYYQPSILEDFAVFIRETKTPVLAICGGHQFVGLSFGARVITLDKLEQHEQRAARPQEYQYRFIRITEPDGSDFQEHQLCGPGDARAYSARLAEPRAATRSRTRRIRTARDVVSLSQPDDGEAQLTGN